MVNLTNEEHQRLCELANRAEAAEVRAAQAEAERDDLRAKLEKAQKKLDQYYHLLSQA